ncbi:MAG: hypothetical protein ACKVQR_12975 [Aquabacterium sp.]
MPEHAPRPGLTTPALPDRSRRRWLAMLGLALPLTARAASAEAARDGAARLLGHRLRWQAQPPEMWVEDGAGTAMRLWPLPTPSPPLAAPALVLAANLRRSFIVAPQALAQLWEISVDPRAEDFYEGLVHDYRMGEGVPTRGYLGLRRIIITEPLHGLRLDAHQAEAIGHGAADASGRRTGYVINLDVRRVVSTYAM